MTIADVISNVIDLKNAVTDGNYKEVWRLEIVLQQAAYDTIFPAGVQAAPAVSAAAKTSLVAACDDLDCTCKAELAKAHAVGAAGDSVGKLGDGTLLKVIVELLPLILSLFG